MDEVNTFTPGRTVDIDLGTAEVITIDLDNLDPNPDDVLDLLKDGQCKDWVWTKLAGEYWRKGYLEGAERIALTAVDCKSLSRCASATNPLCSFSIKRIDCLASFYLLSSGQSYDRSVEASSQTYTCWRSYVRLGQTSPPTNSSSWLLDQVRISWLKNIQRKNTTAKLHNYSMLQFVIPQNAQTRRWPSWHEVYLPVPLDVLELIVYRYPTACNSFNGWCTAVVWRRSRRETNQSSRPSRKGSLHSSIIFHAAERICSGEYSLHSTQLQGGTASVPRCLAVQSQLSAWSSDRYWSLFMGHGWQDKGKGCMAEESWSGKWCLTFFLDHWWRCSRIPRDGSPSYFLVLRLSTSARILICLKPTERRLSSLERSF